ncbi:hypothetical protein V5F44_17790 [Xanthobacter sp. V2C-8]|uniref:hypothetical protein n=1 Tax=Xanthobacter albus TaxID=3119929 RepID=UPI0037288AF2
MKPSFTACGAEGLAARLAARALAPATAALAARAAGDLSARITVATGAAPRLAGTPERPVVRVADPVVLARVRGDAVREGDPVLDQVRLDFARGRAPAGKETP